MYVPYDGQITRNIWLSEIACKDEKQTLALNSDILKFAYIIQDFIYFLEKEYKCYIQVEFTSWYRTVDHNKQVGGADDSKHLLGIAADCKFFKFINEKLKQISTYEIHKKAKKFRQFKGLGLYDTFNHLDIRDGEFKEWDERGK